MSDEYGDAYDYVDHARRPVSMAQDVLVRAVVYARERAGRWDDIAEALNLTAEQARDQYTAAMEQWEDALNRPWERSGRFLSSRLPDGTTEPDETAADLDQVVPAAPGGEPRRPPRRHQRPHGLGQPARTHPFPLADLTELSAGWFQDRVSAPGTDEFRIHFPILERIEGAPVRKFLNALTGTPRPDPRWVEAQRAGSIENNGKPEAFRGSGRAFLLGVALCAKLSVPADTVLRIDTGRASWVSGGD